MAEPNAFDLLKQSYAGEQAAEPNAFDLLKQSYGYGAFGPPPEMGVPAGGTLGGITSGTGTFGRKEQQDIQKLIDAGNDPSQARAIYEAQRNMTPSTLGRTIGGIAGSLIAPSALNLIPPFAALPEEVVTYPLAIAKGIKTAAPVIGAGIGGGIGEATQVGVQEKRLLTGRELRNAMLKEMGYEVGGRAIPAALKFGLGPGIKQPVKGTEKFIDDFTKLGGTLPPSQLDRRLSVRVADEVSRGAFGVKDLIEKMEAKGAKAADLFADNMLDEIAGTTRHMSNTAIAHAVKEGFDNPGGMFATMKNDLFERLYGQIDDMTQSRRVALTQRQVKQEGFLKVVDELGRPIPKMTESIKQVGERVLGVAAPTKSLKEMAKRHLAMDQGLVKWSLRGKRRGPLLSPIGQKIIRQVENLPDEIGFKDLQKLRSTWLIQSEKLARETDISKAIVKQFTGQMSKMMRDPALMSRMSPQARNLLLNTNRLYGAAQEAFDTTFNEKVLQTIVDRPGRLPKVLLPDKAPEAIKQLREGLIRPIPGKRSASGEVLFRQIRRARLADMVDAAVDLEKGTVVPHKFERELHKLGTEALNELIPDKRGKDTLSNVREMLKTMSSKPTGSAALFIKGGQVTGAYMMYTGSQDGDVLGIGAGAVLVFGPRAFMRLAAHPLGNKLLRSGLKLKPGSSALAPTVARLTNLLRQMDRKELAEQKALTRPKYPGPVRHPRMRELRGFRGRGY
jgi:hypothetical protein